MTSQRRTTAGLALRAALALTALSVAAAAWLGSAVLWRDLRASPNAAAIDFLALYTGGRLFVTRPLHLYDLEAQAEVERDLVYPDELAEGLLPFPYPPYVAAVLAPLDGLGFSGSYTVVSALNVGLLALALGTIVVRGRMTAPSAGWLLLAAAVALPVPFTIVQGQVSILVLLLLAQHVFDLREERDVRAGIWLGLLAFKPQLLPIPVLLMVRRRQWRGLAIAATVAAGAWAAVLPRVGLGAVEGYMSVVRTLGAAWDTLGVHPDQMLNLRALAIAVLPESWWTAAWLAVAAVLVLAVLWPPPDGNPGRRGSAWHWGAATVAVVLISPHVNLHDVTLLLLVVGLALSEYRMGVPLAPAAAAVALAALPTLVVTIGGAEPEPSVVAVIPAALLIAFTVLLRANAREASRRLT